MRAKKLAGAVIGVVLLAVAGVAIGATVQYDRLFAQRFVVADHPVAATTSPEDLTEGQRLLKARGCAECHGSDYGGKAFLDDPGLGKMYSSNLTGGKGSRVAQWDDLALEKVIRHSVRPDGSPLFFMPAHEFWYLSDVELARIVQALRQLPKVDREQPANEATLLLKALSVAGIFDALPAGKVDHQRPHEAAPEPGPTQAFGKYLAVTCTGCHGEGFAGGPIPGAPPSMPVPTNITPAKDGLGTYSKDAFVAAMRTGKRPDGSDLNPFMPWKVYKEMTDVELEALYAYLTALPAKPTGSR